MKTLNPIFFREIYALPRQKYFYLKRILVVILPLLFSLGTLDSSSFSRGLLFFQFFAYFSLVLLSFLAIISALPLIIKEKKSNGLLLLLLTRMSPGKIILGKFASCFFFLSLVYCAFLPFAVLSIGLGGISSSQIWATFFLTISSLGLSIAITMFLAVLFKERWAFFGTVVIVFFYLPFATNLTPGFSPVRAIQECLEKGLVKESYRVCLSQLAGTIVLLIGASISLSRIGHFEWESPSAEGWRKKWIFRKKVKKEKVLLGKSNPVFWRDYYKTHGKRKYKWVFCFLLTIFIFFSTPDPLFLLPTNFFGISALLMLYQCLNSFRREKEDKIWELLLITGLSSKEIYWGKVKAIVQSNYPFFVSGVLSLLVYACFIGLEKAFLFFVGTLMFYGWTILVYSMALYLSLHYTSFLRAFVQLFLFIVAVHIINGLLVIILGTFFFFGVGVFFVLALLYTAFLHYYYELKKTWWCAIFFFLCCLFYYSTPFFLYVCLPLVIIKRTQRDIQNYFSLEPFTWKRIFRKDPVVKSYSFAERKHNNQKSTHNDFFMH